MIMWNSRSILIIHCRIFKTNPSHFHWRNGFQLFGFQLSTELFNCIAFSHATFIFNECFHSFKRWIIPGLWTSHQCDFPHFLVIYSLICSCFFFLRHYHLIYLSNIQCNHCYLDKCPALHSGRWTVLHSLAHSAS